MTPTNEAGHGLPELPEPLISGGNDKSRPDLGRGCTGYTAAQVQQYARDALAVSRGVPDDMVLVPRVPTEAMLEAAFQNVGPYPSLIDYWRAMIKAAPAAAGAQGEVHGAVPQREEAKSTFVPCDCGCGRSCCAFCGNDVGFVTKAPQPAAADGGVRELPAMTPERCAFFLRRFKNDEKMLGPNEQLALDYAIAALSSHRQAGDGDGWEENFSYLLGRCKHTLRSREGGGAESLLQSAVLTFTRMEYLLDNRDQAPPPGPDLSKFRELAEGWAQHGEALHANGFDIRGAAMHKCARELLALVEKGAGS